MSNEDPQAQPPIPPVPPAPPAPPAPPVPQYGEYATQPPAPPAAPATPYGYAAAPEYGYPVETTGRKRRTWDLVLTIVLLVVGFFGAGIGVIYGFIFLSPDLINQVFEQQGYGSFEGNVGSAGVILILSHALLYLITVGVSILLLVKKVITFWLPLSVGVLAAIIFWVTVSMVFLSDPDFITTGTGL
jgi:hypothetical protein